MSDHRPTRLIQHRCPNMHRHDDGLPIPCVDCYSLEVTAIRTAYQPSVPSTPIGAISET